MPATAHELPTEAPRWIGPATVTAIDGRAVTLDDSGPRAALAVLGYAPRPGDQVLVARDGDRAWVIGVLAALRPAEEEDETRLERDPTTGRTVLHSRGDLDVSTDGALRLRAARGVEIATDRTVSVDADALRATAARTELRSKEARLVASHATLVADTARRVAGVLETRAGRIVERARDVYREVDGLSQTRATRVRTVVRDAYHLLAGRGRLEAEGDLSLDGERIRLG